MQKLYLLPIETIGNERGPKYLDWQAGPPGPGLRVPFAMMDYGFMASGLVLILDIGQVDHDALILNSDIYAFPDLDSLDQPVDDPAIDPFFEAVNIPTDWLTPATTYTELLRQTAGMFQFNQRYGGIAAEETGELHSIFDNATLETRLRQLTAQEQAWFDATVASFGFDPALINRNSQLRLLIRQAADFWVGQSFFLGGFEF